MKYRKSMSKPSNGIGFSTACGVLYEIAFSWTVYPGLGHKTTDRFELMYLSGMLLLNAQPYLAHSWYRFILGAQ